MQTSRGKIKYHLELQEQLKRIEAELRVGGGATLGDLYDVARAAENDLQDIRNKIEWIFGFFEWQDYLRQTPPKQEADKKGKKL